jgi:hypothetical protein
MGAWHRTDWPIGCRSKINFKFNFNNSGPQNQSIIINGELLKPIQCLQSAYLQNITTIISFSLAFLSDYNFVTSNHATYTLGIFNTGLEKNSTTCMEKKWSPFHHHPILFLLSNSHAFAWAERISRELTQKVLWCWHNISKQLWYRARPFAFNLKSAKECNQMGY